MQWTLMCWKSSILFEEIAVATCAEEKVGPDNLHSTVRTFHDSLHSPSSYVNCLVNPKHEAFTTLGICDTYFLPLLILHKQFTL